jgi:hypothetical protein
MKRGMGGLALLAVLASAAHWMVSPSASRLDTASSSAAEHFPQLPGHVESLETTCSEFSEQPAPNKPGSKGELAALVDQYLDRTTGQPKPDSGVLPANIQFIVATLPDPLHTHLNLQFDRTIDSIQQAAQDEKYTYDSSWLPWKDQAAEYSRRADQDAEEESTARREQCPGLMLFRRSIQPNRGQRYDDEYTKGLFVLLVAEKPTTGINLVQWNNALDWIVQHADRKSSDWTLRVLAPTFSGSIPSLTRALVDLGRQKSPFTSVLVYTGTVRSCSAYLWLNDELSTSNTLPVRTADFEQNDAIQIDRYFEYLFQRGHLPSEVAVLSEDETAYGGLPDSQSDDHASNDGADRDRVSGAASSCEPGYRPESRPLHLYYPRDISAVRSAYQEQSIFGPATAESSGTAHVVLQPQAKVSSHNDTDTVPNFSGVNSALAQEAQLYGIVDSLRMHGIRFVILRSTSTLDYIFLTRFLHHAYPDAFIVTMGPDMLFTREIDSTEFRGVAALTAFPLLPRGQDWTLEGKDALRHAHRVFGSNSMEGAYLATRFLISDPGVVPNEQRPYDHRPKTGIPDYKTPFWDKTPTDPLQPPTWLSVVGRNGYWPLAILTEPFQQTQTDTKTTLHSNLALVVAPEENETDKASRITQSKFSLLAPWKLCCALALLAIGLHFFACRFGWKHEDLGIFVQFTPLAGRRQLFVISVGWAAIGSLLVLMFRCSEPLAQFLEPRDLVWIWFLWAAAWFGVLASALDVGLRSYNEPCSTHRSLPRAIAWITFPWLLLGAAFWAASRIFDAIPTVYRAIHITSGVSPMISLLVMLSGVYWWSWQTLSGLALLGEGRPILPRLPLALNRISNQMAGTIEAFALPLPSIRKGRGVFYLFPMALIALVVFALLRPSVGNFDSMLHSLENKPFSLTLHAMLGIAVFLLILESTQLLTTWLALKRLLLALNRTPLRRTFAALQGLSMHSLWSMSGTSSRARYTIFSHQMESLFHLGNVLQSLDSPHCKEKTLRAVVIDGCKQGRAFVEERAQRADMAMINDQGGRRARVVFCDCAMHILNDLLLPEWLGETCSLDLAEKGSREESNEALPLSAKLPVRRAEEFVCLIYVGYLQNLLARMRTMILSLLGVYAALAFSFALYPYTPRPTIALALLLLLVVVGSLVSMVYAGLDRDATLSHITNTEPGTLKLDFWLRLLSFIGVPVMGLLVAQFPEITDFVVSWVQPSLSAVK